MEGKIIMNKKEETQIYKALLKTIDNLSFGFPKSYLKSDIALIKKLFTVDDAKDFIMMGDGWITIKSYADKNNLSEEEAKAKLEGLANKALIFRVHKEDHDEFRQFPFVLGFLEFQVEKMDKGALMQTGLYMISSKFGKRMSQTMPFYRSVPINKEVVEGSKVLPYDDIDAILDRHTRFAVAPCICRIMYKMKPFNKCNHPIETCITTDDYATFYIENKIGREITKQEARQIMLDGEKDGRIINVTNSKDGENICSCCKCGCGMLYLKMKYPGPGTDYWSNYYSSVDNSKCVKCYTCIKKCTFGYIKKRKDGYIKIDTKGCLGCGICVKNCPTKALTLKMKEKTYEPPETYEEAIEIWQEKTAKDYKNFK